ncbi:protein transport protein bos1 [Teratosphaeriaceae sp. CCFEE 6253]|nr:protein transport protein bos1 [Teratosphaeriaceae sp. CCFEE 6253]
MSALYNSALRQSKAIRADLTTLSSTRNPPTSLHGQLTTSLTSFARTLDDYQKNIDVELVPEKADKGCERIANFRSELLEYRSRAAELKHEKEALRQAEDRNELLGRRGYTADGTGTPENPYNDAVISNTARQGQNINPLFRTNNPNFAPGASGTNSYSNYQSPYALPEDQERENHALKENNFFSSANTTLDEYLERGRAVLGDLGDQREVLKGTQRKLYSVGTTLGISGDTMRMVERRAKQDKWIFWGGVVVFIIFVYFVLRWLR